MDEIMKSSKLSLIFICVILIISLFPFNIIIAPERILYIFDSDEKSLSGVLIRQHWDQYTLGVRGEEDFISNNNGEVILPKRMVRTRMISLVFGAITQTIQLGIHASYSSEESIGVFASGYPDKWFYNGEGIREGKVILHKSSRD